MLGKNYSCYLKLFFKTIKTKLKKLYFYNPNGKKHDENILSFWKNGFVYFLKVKCSVHKLFFFFEKI